MDVVCNVMGWVIFGGWSAVEASFWRGERVCLGQKAAELVVSAGEKGCTADCKTAEGLEFIEISYGTFSCFAMSYSRWGTEATAEGIKA
ncbi:MAG: hypothetical protein ACTS41_01740 [Candidatus Hodgkinia cicadicola]